MEKCGKCGKECTYGQIGEIPHGWIWPDMAGLGSIGLKKEWLVNVPIVFFVFLIFKEEAIQCRALISYGPSRRML